MKLPAHLAAMRDEFAEEYLLEYRSIYRAAFDKCFEVLAEAAGKEFPSKELAEFIGYHSVDIPQLHQTESPALFEFALRVARQQATLSQAKIEELRGEVERLFDRVVTAEGSCETYLKNADYDEWALEKAKTQIAELEVEIARLKEPSGGSTTQ